MLKQSKGLPITLKGIRIVDDSSPQAKKILAGNLSRLQDLGLTFESCSMSEVDHWARKVFNPKVTPKLKTLNIVLDNHGYSSISAFASGVQVPDVDLRLSSLAVKNGWVDFHVDRVQETLTTFRLKLPSISEGANNTKLGCLRKTLPIMPNLTSLSIADTASAHGFASSSGPRISLPHLQMLRCSGNVANCLVTLDVLELPPTTHFDFRIQDYGEAHLDDLHTFISEALRRRRDANSDSGSTTTAYDVLYLAKVIHRIPRSNAYRVVVFESSHPSPSTPSTHRLGKTEDLPILSLQFSDFRGWSQTKIQFAQLHYLSRLIDVVLPSESVRTLRIHSDLRFKAGRGKPTKIFSKGVLQPKYTFLTCSGVKTLYIGDPWTAEFVAPFLRMPKASSSNGASKAKAKEFLTFPNLETLILRDLDPKSGMANAAMIDAMQDVQSAMEERARAGRKLKMLEVWMPRWTNLEGWVKKVRDMGWVDGEVLCHGQGEFGGHDNSPLDAIGSDDEED